MLLKKILSPDPHNSSTEKDELKRQKTQINMKKYHLLSRLNYMGFLQFFQQIKKACEIFVYIFVSNMQAIPPSNPKREKLIYGVLLKA